MQAYLDAIRNNVCPVCLDAVMAGNQFVRCGLPTNRRCRWKFICRKWLRWSNPSTVG